MYMKSLKRVLCWILAVTMVLGLLPSAVLAIGSTSFKDVKDGDWFKEAVEYVAAEGLMVGVGGNKFDPNGQTTRAMVVTVLYRMEGEPEITGTGFSDTGKHRWYSDAVIWAKENGIVNGYGDNTFRPDVTMTREEMVAVFYRYSEYKGYDISATNSLSTYSDHRSIQTYAVDAMGWAVSVGLITGFPDGTIRPQGQSTRAQLATVLMRFCNITDNMSQEPIVQLITDENLVYDKDNDEYWVYDELNCLNGYLINSNLVIEAKCTLLINECEVVAFDFTPETAWKIEPFGLLGGRNVLVFKLSGENGEHWTQFVNLICTNDGNIGDVIDNSENNADEDSLPDYIENIYGTDPTCSDTDGDGLADDIESAILGCDARKFDSDENCVSDGMEDPDGDGLTNLDEISAKTNPNKADTDNDGLVDFDEIHSYGTDPLQEDTDSDGLKDGWEIDNGTDPLAPDESFSLVESLQTGDSSAEIEVDLPGDQVESLSMEISNEDAFDGAIPGQLSEPISLEMDGELPVDGARLKFVISDEYPSNATEDFSPVIYYFNPETQMLEAMPTTYANHTAETHLEHFSTYILLNSVAFDKIWEEEIRTPGDENQDSLERLDVVLVIDSSGSMYSNDKQNIRLQAAKNFVEKLGEKDRGAVIDFDGYSSILCSLTNDKDILYNAINKIDSSGGTNLTLGIAPAIDMLMDMSDPAEAYRYIIMLTDGQGTYDNDLTEMAKEQGISIYTIGLGSGVDEYLLKTIADETSGKYYFATTADDLIPIYEETAVETIDYSTDSNNDGISDYFTRLICEGKLRTGTGVDVFRDAMSMRMLEMLPESADINEVLYRYVQSNADLDGDRIRNGDELIIAHHDGKVYIKLISDPTDKNSDADPFTDDIEFINGGHPLEYDIFTGDVDFLVNDSAYLASYSANSYVDNFAYRAELGIGNYVYGGEYVWYYTAEKQLLESIENYSRRMTKYYETWYLIETYLSKTEEVLSEVKDRLSAIMVAYDPVTDAHYMREIMAAMAELTEAKKALEGMSALDNLEEVTAQCKTIGDLYGNIESNIKSLGKVDFTELNCFSKINVKVPICILESGDALDKIGKGLGYTTATINTITEVGSTISGYAKITANCQTYAGIYNMLCRLEASSNVGFVQIAAYNLRKSTESQIYHFLLTMDTLIGDVIQSWDDVAIDAALTACGPVGWAVNAGLGLGNLIGGTGKSTAEHIRMITAGEAGNAAGYVLSTSLPVSEDLLILKNDDTFELMLLCGVIRSDGEKKVIAATNARGWLVRALQWDKDVPEQCESRINLIDEKLRKYGMSIK